MKRVKYRFHIGVRIRVNSAEIAKASGASNRCHLLRLTLRLAATAILTLALLLKLFEAAPCFRPDAAADDICGRAIGYDDRSHSALDHALAVLKQQGGVGTFYLD
jgi:hypothetical protein